MKQKKSLANKTLAPNYFFLFSSPTIFMIDVSAAHIIPIFRNNLLSFAIETIMQINPTTLIENNPLLAERPGDALAGHKHHVTNQLLNYLKQETMTMCQNHSLYQVDLLSPATSSDSVGGKFTVPNIKNLKEEKEKLVIQKNSQYEEYSYARARYRELQTVHRNVDSILHTKTYRKQLRSR